MRLVTDDRATTEAVAGLFGRAASTYDTVIPFFATFGHRLVELAGVAPGERVLDVATGRGAVLFPAAERVGLEGMVLGVDLAPEMVELVTADLALHHLPNVSVRRMDAQCLELPDASFDVVVSGFALFLLPEPPRAAAEFRRVLRPGGRCAASMPVGANSHWDFFGPLVSTYASRAVKPMPPRPSQDCDMAAVLADAGFRQVETVEEEASFVFPDAEAWWRWVWSVGLRAPLEALPPDALTELKAEAFEHLSSLTEPDGLQLHQRARFVKATAPQR